jgi:hypothetical protein
MSASGLPGNRDEAMRAGIRTMVDMSKSGLKRCESKVAKRLMDAALIGVATPKQKT